MRDDYQSEIPKPVCEISGKQALNGDGRNSDGSLVQMSQRKVDGLYPDCDPDIVQTVDQ